ncbi:unnamed protein product [Durusdinium trenchii]|uniref:Uncharacterized protein n=1 Tax=Durusdinium trenchii TaxID=1381693 RepID=A0ABP0NGB3_9DINO
MCTAHRFNAGFMTTMLNTDVVSFIILLTYQLLGSLTLMNMLTGVMVDVVGTTAQLEQEEQSLKTLKRDIADVVNLTDENHDRTVTAVEFTHMTLGLTRDGIEYEGGVNVLALVDYADFVFRDTSELSLEEFIETVLQFRGQSPATVKDVVDLRVFVSKDKAQCHRPGTVQENLSRFTYSMTLCYLSRPPWSVCVCMCARRQCRHRVDQGAGQIGKGCRHCKALREKKLVVPRPSVKA